MPNLFKPNSFPRRRIASEIARKTLGQASPGARGCISGGHDLK